MTTELMQRARAGLAEVELTWWEPGDWDCHGREAVLATFRERVASGSAEARIELLEAGDGSVVAMRQFRDRSEALAAVR